MNHSFMDSWSTDLQLRLIEYLPVRDANRLAACSKQWYYVIHAEYRRSLSEVVTIASWNPTTQQHIPTSSLLQTICNERLRTKPNLVLVFQQCRHFSPALQMECARRFETPERKNKNQHQQHQRHQDPQTIVLCAVADNLQSVNTMMSSTPPPANASSSPLVECQSRASIMCCHFPHGRIRPFSFTADESLDALLTNLRQEANEHGDNWKAMMIYASPQGAFGLQNVIVQFQLANPGIEIMGGVCQDGYVSMPHIGESSIDATVWGVMLSDGIPIRSVVSVGVKSELRRPGEDGSLSSSPYVVEEVTLKLPGGEQQEDHEGVVGVGRTSAGHDHFHNDDDEDDDDDGDRTAVHLIQSIRDTTTNTILSTVEFLTQSRKNAVFVGLKRPGQDGYAVHMLITTNCETTESFLIRTDGSTAEMASLKGAALDIFTLDGETAKQDMDRTVALLKNQTTAERLLGAVMFICTERGPDAGDFINEAMSDATRFHRGFAHVPCCGFFAVGEIGPLALEGNENVFQPRTAAAQASTAVFALFVVPERTPRRAGQEDGSQDTIDEFIASRLHSPTTTNSSSSSPEASNKKARVE